MLADCIKNSHPSLGVVLGGLSVQPSGTALVLLSKKKRARGKRSSAAPGETGGDEKKAQNGKPGAGRGGRSVKNVQLQIEVAKNKP